MEAFRTRFSRRTAILILDALFGVLLLAVGLSGSVGFAPATSTTTPGSTELTARLGNVTPPGQSTGFAVARDGSLALVDRSRQVVLRFDANGQRTAEWGPSFGPGLDAKDLVGLAADADGWALLDRGAQRILRLDAQGRAMADRTINLDSFATYGPNGLASDGRGNLYMADTGRDRIVVIDSNGKQSGVIGDAGSELGKFKQPMFAGFAPDGAMLVTDWENGRIQRFDADRHPTNAWPVAGHAWGIAVDPLGRVFVPDADHRLVRMFGQDGSLLAQFGAADAGGAPLAVDTPSQVGVSPDGQVLWIVGVDGLARADLTPFAQVRPSTPAASRTPLAALGALMLLIAAAIASWPFVRGARRPRFRAASATPATLDAPHSPEAPDGPDAKASDSRRPRGFVLADLPLWPRTAAALGIAFAGVGLAVAVAAGFALATPTAKLDPWPRMLWLGVGSLVFAIGCGISARALPWRLVADWPACVPDASPRTRRVGLIGAALATVLSLAAAVTWWQYRFQTVESTRGAYIWLAGLLVAVATTLYYTRPRLPRLTVWALIPWLLFALALVPRAWNNANLPFGVWFDEAEGGLQARRFLVEGRFTPITDTYGRDASLYYYLMAAAQAVISDPVLAQRLVSAIVGAACVPLIFLMGRELFGWRVGLAAAVLLAASRWHVDVSRLGWDPISLPFCAILAIWLLARAVRTQRLTDAVWAGLAVGLGLHGYIGSRALPIVGLGMLVYAAWWLRWRPSVAGSRFVVVLAAALLAALPVVLFAIQDPGGFNGRLNQTLILNEPVSQAQKLDEIWSNLQKHLLMFHVSGDLNGRHNLPGLPMLDAISGVLAVLGLAVLLSRPFDWRSIILVGWAVVSLLGGVLTFPFEAPQAMRTLGITPMLATFVALALVLIADRIRALLPFRFAPRAVAAVAVAPVIAIAWINLTTFFGPQMNNPTVWESFSTRETIPARELLNSQQPLEAILGSPTIAPTLQQQLLVPDRQSLIRPFDAATSIPYRGQGPAMIILETEHEAGLADELARYYPGATRRDIVPPNGTRPTVEELILDQAVLASHRGLQMQGDTWRGLVAIDAPGAYAFRGANGAPLTLDGAPLGDSDRVQLARGNHVLTIRGPQPLVDWQTPSASDWQPVDPAALYVAPEGGTGLEATFYPSADFQGNPTEVIVDPIVAHYYHTSPLARLNISPPAWSAEWRGEIDAPVTGAYRFDAERLSRAALWIDERPVFDDITSDGGAPNGQVQLTAGRHQIRIRLTNRGDGGPRMYLYWTPPNAGRTLVPGQALYPPPPGRAGS